MIKKTNAPLVDFMQSGAIIITPNNRLSNQLLHDYFTYINNPVIDKPSCLPYQAFLQRLHTDVCHHAPHLAHPVILDSLQCHALWTNIINADDAAQDGLLHEVQSAWTNCRHWQIAIDDPAFTHTPQTRQFQLWQQSFQAYLTDINALTPEQIIDYALPYLKKLGYKAIVWACFNGFTPQQNALQQALSALDCPQFEYDITENPEMVQQYAAKDRHDEYQQMTAWVKQRLAAGDNRIGVVIPDLQSHSHQLLRFILRHLPAHQFNLSLGEPLADYPLVAHALAWIALEGEAIPNETARLLLQSPYLDGAKSEFLKRADCLQNSKLLKEALISKHLWVNDLEGKAPKLAALLQALQPYPEKASPRQWAECFKRRLIQMGFPGEYALNSQNYQCLSRLEGLFESFMALATVSEVLPKNKAIAFLRHLAKTTIFQFKKPTTPVVILGLLEASGCTFDSLWVCGMDDQCLPQKTRLSPFIPMELQRELNMPKARPEKELHYAELNLNRLQQGAKQSVFSFPRLLGDMPNMPCPLIQSLPEFQAQPLTKRQTTKLELRDETYQLPIPADENLSGGTSLLANQAKCPFRAFAAHRLHAKTGPRVSAGPDASERGQIVHKIMEIIWQRLCDQRTLLSIPKATLSDYISQAINESLDRYTSFRRFSFPALLKDIEVSRLKTLVQSSLEWEKQRPDFTVHAIEKTFDMTLGGIQLTIRVDRLDRVGDNKWVIDYKSTIPTNKPWNADRPEEPQLLLYALLDEQINALLFLQLKTGQLACSGISEDNTELEGLNPLKKGVQWLTQKQNWQSQLVNLADELHQGHCSPQPIRSSLCQQCDFPGLCRVGLIDNKKATRS